MREVFEWAKAILIAVIIAYILRAFIFERAVIDGDSMNDTLVNNQQLIVYKLGYVFHVPKRGDIVVIEHDPGKYNKYVPLRDPTEVDYIKRVIGVPGDTINLKDGHVYIKDKKAGEFKEIKEAYVKGLTYSEGMGFPIKIPKNKILVFGDNRENSSDSRSFGLVDFSKVRGKAIFRIFPFKDMGFIYK